VEIKQISYALIWYLYNFHLVRVIKYSNNKAEPERVLLYLVVFVNYPSDKLKG
jgi:hypothetical protein